MIHDWGEVMAQGEQIGNLRMDHLNTEDERRCSHRWLMVCGKIKAEITLKK